MHTKPGFTLRTMMGKHVLVAEGAELAHFDKIISFNETAAMLWRRFEGHDFTVAEMAEALVEAYGIDMATALADSGALADKWMAEGLVE